MLLYVPPPSFDSLRRRMAKTFCLLLSFVARMNNNTICIEREGLTIIMIISNDRNNNNNDNTSSRREMIMKVNGVWLCCSWLLLMMMMMMEGVCLAEVYVCCCALEGNHYERPRHGRKARAGQPKNSLHYLISSPFYNRDSSQGRIWGENADQRSKVILIEVILHDVLQH